MSDPLSVTRAPPSPPPLVAQEGCARPARRGSFLNRKRTRGPCSVEAPLLCAPYRRGPLRSVVGIGEILLDIIDGAELFEVRFELEVVTPGRRGQLVVETPLGNPAIDARIEVTPRSPWLEPETLPAVGFPVHRGYEFGPVPAPVMSAEESLAEKLAAFRRRSLLRDLYDLAWFGQQGAMNEELVRRLTYLKTYVDVVDERLGSGPFDPEQDVFGRREDDFPAEDIGLLSGAPDIAGWLRIVRERFAFLQDPTAEEQRWAACDPRDAYEVSQVIAGLR